MHGGVRSGSIMKRLTGQASEKCGEEAQAGTMAVGIADKIYIRAFLLAASSIFIL
jgi:hypothetical protein